MSKFSLIILIGMSECWEALFLSNLSMSFFMASILTSDKRNVSFSQCLCIASMLGWSFYLNIALRVGSAMFSVTGSNSLYLEIFRFFTIFEKKLFRLSTVPDSVFKTLPFSLMLILSLMRDLSESKGFTDFQNIVSSLRFSQKRYTVIPLPIIKNFIFFCSISQKLFRSLDLFIISLESCFAIKGI